MNFLSLNSLFSSEVAYETYTKFEVDFPESSQSLCIKVDPLSEDSDPDLYVARQTDVSMNASTWKCATGGPESVEIHPGHADFGPGKYYVGVYGANPGLNRFSILCYLKTVREIKLLAEDALLQEDGSQWNYYKILVKHAGESRIVVTVKPGVPLHCLFLSPTQMYPTERDHYCSAGYFCGRANVYRPDSDWADTETLFDLDPFDAQYPRSYMQNPGPSGVTQEEADKQEELTICVDTDEWIANSRVCHIAVKSANASPFTITGREIHEKELLAPCDLTNSALISSLFAPFDLVDISYAERLRKDIAGEREFTYGEVDYVHFRAIFEFLDLRPGQEFWDLGSGAGKCLLTVALCCPQLGRVVGVEMLDDLYDLSSRVIQQLPADISAAPISLIHGDFFAVDWSSADCVYASNLCFPENQLAIQLQMLQRLKPGAHIISLIRFRPCAWLSPQHFFRVKMTWGKAEVYLYTRN